VISYNPKAWYWSGPLGVFSSAKNALVSDGDAAYAAWVAAGGVATVWPRDEAGAQTTAALDEVLLAAGLPASGLTPAASGELLAYADAKLSAYWTGAISVNVGTEAAPVRVTVDASSKGQTFVSGLLADISLGASTETWYQDGGSLQLTADQVRAIGLALKAYVDAAMTVWQQAERGIGASPATITTAAEIDALAWPARAAG